MNRKRYIIEWLETQFPMGEVMVTKIFYDKKETDDWAGDNPKKIDVIEHAKIKHEKCKDCVIGCSCTYGKEVLESDTEEWLLETIEGFKYTYCPHCGSQL